MEWNCYETELGLGKIAILLHEEEGKWRESYGELRARAKYRSSELFRAGS
jgi:hypothetical protein